MTQNHHCFIDLLSRSGVNMLDDPIQSRRVKNSPKSTPTLEASVMQCQLNSCHDCWSSFKDKESLWKMTNLCSTLWIWCIGMFVSSMQHYSTPVAPTWWWARMSLSRRWTTSAFASSSMRQCSSTHSTHAWEFLLQHFTSSLLHENKSRLSYASMISIHAKRNTCSFRIPSWWWLMISFYLVSILSNPSSSIKNMNIIFSRR